MSVGGIAILIYVIVALYRKAQGGRETGSLRAHLLLFWIGLVATDIVLLVVAGLLAPLFWLLLPNIWHLLRQGILPWLPWRPAVALGWLAGWSRNCRLSDSARQAGLLALACQRRQGPVIPWLRNQRFTPERPVDGASLVALALVEHLEGRAEESRILLETAVSLPIAGRDRISERLALDALAAGAAAAGDWPRLENWQASTSRLGFLLGALARCRRDPTAGHRLALALAWLLAPGRRRTWAPCRAAWSQKSAPAPAEKSSVSPTLPDVLQTSAALTRRPDAELAGALRQAAHDLQAGGALDAWAQARAERLGLDAEAAALAAREALERGLRELAAVLPPAAAAAFETGFSEGDQALLAVVEAAAEMLEAQLHADGRWPIDETLAAWVNFRRLFEQARQRSATLHYAAYGHAVAHDLSAWIARCWNDEKQRLLAYACCAWLLEQSEYFGDSHVAGVMVGNLQLFAGRPPRQRHGVAALGPPPAPATAA